MTVLPNDTVCPPGTRVTKPLRKTHFQSHYQINMIYFSLPIVLSHAVFQAFKNHIKHEVIAILVPE